MDSADLSLVMRSFLNGTFVKEEIKNRASDTREPAAKSVKSTLRHIKKYSYGQSDGGNKIIQGDNIRALDLLHSDLQDRVRCIYIDPPYNNMERYTHYHDILSHDDWLWSVTRCVSKFRDLLTVDGSLWVSIDDWQVHYLKVALDEIFGRQNFVTTIVWQHRTTRENRKIFSNDHEYILVYAKSYQAFKQKRNLLALSPEVISRYKNPDNDLRGPWQSVSANVQAGHGTKSQFYSLVAPNGKRHVPPKGRCWVYTREKMQKEILKNNIWFGRDGNGVPRIKRFFNSAAKGMTPKTLWTSDEVGTTDVAKKQLKKLLPNEHLFDTPKPEPLLRRILEIATSPGDLVLDTYLGSGTTAAVAHKMGRRYVGIEQGEHAVTHCAERLRKVVNADDSGISDIVDWRGGGGFDFYRVRR